ncbi:hypothetical protein Tco_0242602 [Tanacetum coccineum]
MLNHALLAGYCSYKNLTSKLKIEKTRPKKYPELTEAQQLQDDCDVQATKIVVHGLPPDVFVVPTFQQGEDPIDCINKAMTFLSAAASRPRNAAWFKEKLMLTEAQEAAFQTEDLDAYDSDCDDLSSAKAVLMANISSCDSDVLSEVPYSDTYPNDMINQDVQEMTYSEQTYLDDFPDTEINTNLDKENQINKMVNESLTAELERYKERVPIFEQRQNVDLHKREKIIDSQMDDLIRNRNAKLVAFQHEIDTLKETLSTHVKEKKSL